MDDRNLHDYCVNSSDIIITKDIYTACVNHLLRKVIILGPLVGDVECNTDVYGGGYMMRFSLKYVFDLEGEGGSHMNWTGKLVVSFEEGGLNYGFCLS